MHILPVASLYIIAFSASSFIHSLRTPRWTQLPSSSSSFFVSSQDDWRYVAKAFGMVSWVRCISDMGNDHCFFPHWNWWDDGPGTHDWKESFKGQYHDFGWFVLLDVLVVMCYIFWCWLSGLIAWHETCGIWHSMPSHLSYRLKLTIWFQSLGSIRPVPTMYAHTTFTSLRTKGNPRRHVAHLKSSSSSAV